MQRRSMEWGIGSKNPRMAGRVLQVQGGWVKATVCKAHETESKQLMCCFELLDCKRPGSQVSG